MSSLLHQVYKTELKPGDAVTSADLVYTGGRLVVCTLMGEIHIINFNGQNPESMPSINNHQGQRCNAIWAPAGVGDCLLTYGHDGNIVLHTGTGSGYQTQWQAKPGAAIYAAAFLPCTPPGVVAFAYGGESGHLHIIFNENNQWKENIIEDVHYTGITAITVVPANGENEIIIGGVNGFIRRTSLGYEGKVLSEWKDMKACLTPIVSFIPPSPSLPILGVGESSGKFNIFTYVHSAVRLDLEYVWQGSPDSSLTFLMPESDIVSRLSPAGTLEGVQKIQGKWATAPDLPMVPGQ